MNNFGQQNTKNTNNGTFYNQRSQRNKQNYNRNQRFGRSYQNNQNHSSNNGQRRSAEQYRKITLLRLTQVLITANCPDTHSVMKIQVLHPQMQQILAIIPMQNFHPLVKKTLLRETRIRRLGDHKPTSLDGPEKIALRSMEEGYFVPAIVAGMPLIFLVDTGSNSPFYVRIC